MMFSNLAFGAAREFYLAVGVVEARAFLKKTADLGRDGRPDQWEALATAYLRAFVYRLDKIGDAGDPDWWIARAAMIRWFCEGFSKEAHARLGAFDLARTEPAGRA